MPVVLAALIIVLDRISKFLYVNVFHSPDVTVIKGILNLTYVKNKGATWGMFAKHQIALYIFSGIFVLLLLAFFIIEYKKMKPITRYGLAVVLGGAIGNMIDRIFLGYVPDMLEFAFIKFPVFNVADAAITIGGVILFVAVIFFENDESKKKKKTKEEIQDTEVLEKDGE